MEGVGLFCSPMCENFAKIEARKLTRGGSVEVPGVDLVAVGPRPICDSKDLANQVTPVWATVPGEDRDTNVRPTEVVKCQGTFLKSTKSTLEDKSEETIFPDDTLISSQSLEGSLLIQGEHADHASEDEVPFKAGIVETLANFDLGFKRTKAEVDKIEIRTKK